MLSRHCISISSRSSRALSHQLNKSLFNISHSSPSQEVQFSMDSVDKKLNMGDINHSKILSPPGHVKGITVLNYDAFKKVISVPTASVRIKYIKEVLNLLKKYYFKVHKFQSTVENQEDKSSKTVFLCPVTFPKNRQILSDNLQQLANSLNIENSSELATFSESSVELLYQNWNAEDTLRSVLPNDSDIVSGFSIIGHILHLNLKEHLYPFKNIIGQILLDKTRATLIVNKVDTIEDSDNTYRSFKMEVLAGGGSTVATVRENKCVFELDFAKVYWNPRLETEHNNVVKKMRREDVLYDVMAGVGPFSVPAAKTLHCSVIANDLNPESFLWLKRNVELNKVADYVTCYNMDGSDFIKKMVKDDLISRWEDINFTNDIYITMNLPALAIEFLPNFIGLLKDESLAKSVNPCEPVVHVYMFSRDMKASSCITRVAFYLGLIDTLPDFDGRIAETLRATHDALQTDKTIAFERPKFVDDTDTIKIDGLKVLNVRFVRKVSRNKIMVRVSFVLSKDILFSDRSVNYSNKEKYSLREDDNEQPLKKRKVEE